MLIVKAHAYGNDFLLLADDQVPASADRGPRSIVVQPLVTEGQGVVGALGVLIGAADYRFLGAAAGLSALAFLPLAGLTLAVPALGIVGVWAAVNLWMVARAALNRRRFASGAWVRLSAPVAAVFPSPAR